MKNKENKIIFIVGAPGIGKSTVSKLLQKELKTPMFEFGWIPEFRFNGEKEISYVEEESLAFENLSLVVKNYIKNDFSNIIVTDLSYENILKIKDIFSDIKYTLIILNIDNENVLKEKILDDSRSSGYRNFEEGIALNKKYSELEIENSVKIDVDNKEVRVVVDEIIDIIR